jgi:hypothetical protein
LFSSARHYRRRRDFRFLRKSPFSHIPLPRRFIPLALCIMPVQKFCMTAVILYRSDEAKRMHRYYHLDVQPDLFRQ